jgi:hypothetical protein
MAKFVVIAREMFTDLVRGIRKGSGFGPDVERMMGSYQKNRGKIADYYRKQTGKAVPEGKVVIPANLHKALKQESFVKKASQKTAKYESDEEKFLGRLGKPRSEPRETGYTRQTSKRGKITSREAGIWQRPDGSFGATLGGPRRSLGTREMDDMDLAYQRKLDREAAARGRKLNRTRHVTRRTLEEDEF